MSRQVRYGIVAAVVLVLAVVLLVADKGLWAAGLVLAGVVLIGADYMTVGGHEDIEMESPQERTRRLGVGVGGLGSGEGGSGRGGTGSDAT